jgi:hypothetical protein
MSQVQSEQRETVQPVAPVTPKPVAPVRPENELDFQRTEEKVGSLVIQARRALRQGRRAEAKKQLQEALTLMPTDVHALDVLGDVFMEEAEQEKAMKTFEYGLKHHPHHRPFEEKIALCIIDLKEMEIAQERKKVFELGDPESWMNLSPTKAFGLSLLLPGAGHVYANENETGAWVFGAYLFSLLAWMVPLFMGISAAGGAGVKGLDRISFALGNLGGLAFIFWPMLAVSAAAHMYAIFDSMAAAERANERRKHGFDEPVG